jgi:hypothetical protein
MAIFALATMLVVPALASVHRAAASPAPQGHPGSGFLSNFDVYNTTDRTCQGFDVQIEGVTQAEAPYQYYGTYGQPTNTDMSFPSGATGIDVRWAAIDGGGGSWSASTPVGGIDHFGVYVTVQPGDQHLSWLCDSPSNPGHLELYGGTSVGNGYTNNTLSPVPIVQPVIVPTPAGEAVQQNLQNGVQPPGHAPLDAVWYYRYAQSSPDAPSLEQLTPENSQFAVAAMTQSQINDNMNLVDGGQSEAVATESVNSGDAASVWVVEEYAYTGPYDDAHTAMCNETVGDPNNCANFVGDLLSTTVLAANLANGGHRFPVNVAEKSNGANSTTGGSVSSNDLQGVNANPGNIDCGATCTTVVDEGTSVTLTEVPNASYSFTGWSGACSGTASSCTVTASKVNSVTANFSQGLTIAQPASIASLVPRLTAKVTLKGTGFSASSVPSISGSGLTISGTKVTGKTTAASMAFTVTASAGASAGLRNITITTIDGKSVTCTDCLSVHALPSVTSISPSSTGQNSSRSVTITGSGFVAGLKLKIAGGAVTTLASVVRVNGNSITLTLKATKTAAKGPRTITITNTDKGYETVTFTIT